jgi:hypothetical protein
VYEALIYEVVDALVRSAEVSMRPSDTTVWGIKLLVYEALKLPVYEALSC